VNVVEWVEPEHGGKALHLFFHALCIHLGPDELADLGPDEFADGAAQKGLVIDVHDPVGVGADLVLCQCAGPEISGGHAQTGG